MKKRAMAIVLVILVGICSIGGVRQEKKASAAEQVNWNAPIGILRSSGRTDPNRGTLLDESNLGKVYTVQDEVGGWFRMTAPESGDYVFWVLADELKYSHFNISVSLDGKQSAWLSFPRADVVQKGVVKDVKKGQIITWWNDDGSGRGYTLQTPFRMMLTIGETEQPSRIELAGYLGKKLELFRDQVGSTRYQDSDLMGYSAGGATVYSSDNADMTYIEWIKVIEDETYSVCGVHTDMHIDDAAALLTSEGWQITQRRTLYQNELELEDSRSNELVCYYDAQGKVYMISLSIGWDILTAICSGTHSGDVIMGAEAAGGQQTTTTSQSGTVYVHGSSKIRSGPGLGYQEVSSAAAGKTLTWLGEVSVDDRGVMWYKIRRNNGEAAWISSRYSQLETSDGSEPQIPFGKLMKGNKGDRVVELQMMLKELGYHTGSCDGDYGSGTEKSVKAFQNAMGLSVTGEVDEETWQAIEAALQPQEIEEEMSMEEIFAELSVEEEYPMTSYVSGLNRSALIRWLNNKDEWYGHNSGYMLLEQTLDANSNGAWAAAADRMFSYGFDLLNGMLDTLSGNMVGVTSSALDMSVRFGFEFYDPQVIERMLIETYADYMEGMQQEAQAAQEQYNANLTLYEMYKKLKDLYDAGDLVIKGTENADIAMRQILSKELALSDLAYLTLDRQEAWSYAIRKCMTDGNVQPGEVEALDAMWKKYNRYHDAAVRMQQAGVEDKLSMCGYGLDAVSMVNSVLTFCEKYGYEAERYAGMIGFMACTSAEYFSMLDHWADTAERMGADKYAEAIRLFRQDFEEVAQRRIENLIMNSAGQESMDEVVDVVNGAAAIVGDMIEVYRKSKNIDTAQKFSWSIVSRTAENIIRKGMSWDQKAETMEKMVFCRSLKETLAESLIRQLYEFDAMAEGEAKEEKAAVIATGLKYMKTLKYYGEGLALDLCSLLSEGGNYIHAEYQLVAKINGTWAVIEGVIQPPEGEGRYTDTALDLIQMEGLQYGYLKNSSITSTNAGDNELAVTIANRSVWVEFVYALSDASVMTTEEMLEDRQMLESINNRRREQIANDPDYIEYWQDYIEDFSIPAIEWLE